MWVNTRVPLMKLNSSGTVLSSDPETKYFPSGENPTLKTIPVCP